MLGRTLPVDAESARAIVPGAVDFVDLDVLVVSEVFVELSGVPNGLLAVCIGFVDPNIFWLVGVLACVPNAP